MKTKLLLVLVSALTAGTVSSLAQTAPAPATAPAYTIKLTPAVVSQYMFRGMRLGEACFQPSLEVASGAVTAGIWASTPFDDEKVPGVSDPEFDFYASYTGKISDAVTLVPGFTWYLYPDADKSLGFYKSTFEPNVALNYTVGALTLTPKFYYDMVLKGATYEFTAAYGVPLKEINSSLNLSGTVGSYKWDESLENTSPDVKNWGDYWSVNASLPFTVSSNSTLTVGIGYAKGSNNYFKQGSTPRVANTMAIGRAVFSLAYAITF